MFKLKGNKYRYFTLKVFSEYQWYIIIAAVLLLLLFGWSAIASMINIPFSFSAIGFAHRYFFTWIFDIAVLLIPIPFIMFIGYRRTTSRELKEKIEKLQEEVGRSIIIAENIGLGKTECTPDDSSVLQKTLFNLGDNLKETRLKEEGLNWIATGKDKISDVMRMHNRIEDLAYNTLKIVVDYYAAAQAAFFLLEKGTLRCIALHAYGRQRYEYEEIPVGKGLIGEAAYERQLIYRTEIPDDYFTIRSGIIGSQPPRSLLIIPLLQEEEVQGVIEIGFFDESLPKSYLSLADELSAVVGRTLYNLKINARTEVLLKESQMMTSTLRANEDQLKRNAEEMMIAQEELESSNHKLALQIQEVENGQKRLQALLTNASEFISIYNDHRELIFESPSVRRILGYDASDGVSGMDFELLTPRGFKTINSLFDYLLATPGGEQTAQYTYLKKNGSKIFLETQGKNLLHDPAIKGLIFNTQDITERKRAEKEERMKSRMQSLSENSPDMIIRMNPLGKMVYVNPAAAEFMGLDEGSMMKHRISDLDIDQNFIDFVKTTLKNIKTNLQHVIAELEVEMNDKVNIVEIKAIPELGDEDELESVLFVVHDVTEIKRIEQEVKEKNKKISDSINYAQRIQTAILPDTGLLQQFFPRSFVFYRPKDVVSGDFPWFFHYGDVYYVAAVDCTGHGVPGALLSFIGYFLLNNIVNAGRDLDAAHILDELHAAVRSTLKQDKDGANGRDGMDLALCRIDTSSRELQFAGAHRPLYFVRDGVLTEYKGTRKGIGGIPLAKKPESDFELNTIEYQPGDRLFIFSDGLPDQLGGDDKRKYQAKRIREALEMENQPSMQGLARHFMQDFYDWMGDEKQVDDVLLIGIEL
jgi:PAS domain S-box-containing protein